MNLGGVPYEPGTHEIMGILGTYGPPGLLFHRKFPWQLASAEPQNDELFQAFTNGCLNLPETVCDPFVEVDMPTCTDTFIPFCILVMSCKNAD
jgi:hypothetical protein